MKIFIVEHYGNAASAWMEDDVDLDRCFTQFRVIFKEALVRRIIKSHPFKSNKEIADILISIGLYSQHTNRIDVRISVQRLREMMVSKIPIPGPVAKLEYSI